MSFAVGFKPFAEMHTAHHMLMFGCQTPGENLFAKDKKYWYVLNTLMKIYCKRYIIDCLQSSNQESQVGFLYTGSV